MELSLDIILVRTGLSLSFDLTFNILGLASLMSSYFSLDSYDSDIFFVITSESDDSVSVFCFGAMLRKFEDTVKTLLWALELT